MECAVERVVGRVVMRVVGHVVGRVAGRVFWRVVGCVIGCVVGRVLETRYHVIIRRKRNCTTHVAGGQKAMARGHNRVASILSQHRSKKLLPIARSQSQQLLHNRPSRRTTT